mmetsp:Transcript_5062/g.11225  ORF Transcript_5062/g.11225 Transcript_5062/m.11225 type:complete len:230 (-) Transcript_5062:181-870(-)
MRKRAEPAVPADAPGTAINALLGGAKGACSVASVKMPTGPASTAPSATATARTSTRNLHPTSASHGTYSLELLICGQSQDSMLPDGALGFSPLSSSSFGSDPFRGGGGLSLACSSTCTLQEFLKQLTEQKATSCAGRPAVRHTLQSRPGPPREALDQCTGSKESPRGQLGPAQIRALGARNQRNRYSKGLESSSLARVELSITPPLSCRKALGDSSHPSTGRSDLTVNK